MHILNRYIRHAVISSTLVVVIILLALDSFGEFIAQLPDIGKGHFGILQALIYVPLQLPAALYLFFPVAGFIGCLIGLGRLANGSELTVMRAAGVSVGQVLLSVIKAALMMLLFVTVVGEFVAPKLQTYGEHQKLIAMNKQREITGKGNIWLRKGYRFIYLDSIISPTLIHGVTEFQFDQNRHLLATSFAKKAALVNGQWQLEQIVGTRFANQKTTIFHKVSEPLGIALKPQHLQRFDGSSMQGSVIDLWHTIRYRQQAGLVTSLFSLTFWQRIIQPLTAVVMICLGIPFIFGSLRSVSMSVRIITGIAVGFAFYMLSRFFGPITLLYQFPPVLAAVIPTLVFMGVYALMIRRIA